MCVTLLDNGTHTFALVLKVAESASLLASCPLRGFAEWGCQTHFRSSLLNRSYIVDLLVAE